MKRGKKGGEKAIISGEGEQKGKEGKKSFLQTAITSLRGGGVYFEKKKEEGLSGK